MLLNILNHKLFSVTANSICANVSVFHLSKFDTATAERTNNKRPLHNLGFLSIQKNVKT